MTRRLAALCIVLTIALGVASRKVHLGVFVWDKSLGDALYTVMIYFFLAALRPQTRPQLLGLASFVISFAIELFQLTGVPERMPFPINRILGTTFQWHDVACYVVGAAVVTGAHVVVEKKRGASGVKAR